MGRKFIDVPVIMVVKVSKNQTKIFISDIEFILSNDGDEVFFPSDSPYGIFHRVLRKI